MSDLVVGSVTFNSLAGMPAAASGKFWIDSKPTEPRLGRLECEWPGVDGIALKWLGFRGRRLAAVVAYKNTTAALVKGAWQTDAAALREIIFAVTLPDFTAFPNCVLVDGDAFPAGEVQQNLGSGYIMVTHLALQQLRE